MDDDQLLRYSRHILLPELGVEGQQRLLASHALIVGAGGLGSPASIYLAAAGVGRITLCDADSVDLTNLQRQIVHRTQSVGKPKVVSARQTLLEINPGIEVLALEARLDAAALLEHVGACSVVLDCSDNFATRHAVNRACVAHSVPLVSGAAIRFDGQVSVFDLRSPGSACYACLFSEDTQSDEMRCAVMGVFAPLTGIIGTTQAAEAIKLLAGVGQTLDGRLLILDALTMQWRTLRLARDPQCAVCAGRRRG
ncbi:MAG: molybdopterin-synthase adenylyltransferase MoeB [Burkholderiales bacterium]|nr:molybdopterin-synthase adenylyltransferase MoeB [Burkholderiales bacterium]